MKKLCLFMAIVILMCSLVTSCGTSDTAKEPPESIKILAIGNSFSVDAMEYVYQIAKAAGVENVVLGNLYISGCDLETHLANAIANEVKYAYYKNTEGSWSSTKVSFETGLTDEDWDVITMQQASHVSGVDSAFENTLTSFVDIVEEKKTNPDARLMWHMTWAYQKNSTHSGFAYYDKDQTKMYNLIVEMVKTHVKAEKRISGIIPSGTAIQNARTSFTGDTLTRDGYHLSYTLGRYIAGLCYFSAITGVDISDITYSPYVDVTPEVMEMAKDAVKTAIKKPFEVTQSTHTDGVWAGALFTGNLYDAKKVMNPLECYASDKALANAIGIDLDKYSFLEYEYVENAYYYCTKDEEIVYPESDDSTFNQYVCTKKIFTKTEIPVGSIIICDKGWKYRPEKWQSMAYSKLGGRPENVIHPITLIDEAFWGDCNYLALNIVSNHSQKDISDYFAAAPSHVRIYVPAAE